MTREDWKQKQGLLRRKNNRFDDTLRAYWRCSFFKHKLLEIRKTNKLIFLQIHKEIDPTIQKAILIEEQYINYKTNKKSHDHEKLKKMYIEEYKYPEVRGMHKRISNLKYKNYE